MPNIDKLTALLGGGAGVMPANPLNRLDAPVAADPQIVAKEQVLLVRMDGSYFIETAETAAIAAKSDPDFVVAIPLSTLRPLINRSVN